MQNDVAIGVLVEDTDHVLDVEALSTVCQQLLHISIVQLLAIKLLPPKLVNDVTITTLDEPAKAIDASTLLVYVESLLSLQELGDGTTSALIILELKISHQVMRVKVEFLKTEGRGHFTLIVHICSVEQLLLRVVLQDVARGGVLQVAPDICLVTCLVAIVPLTILEDYNVSTVIAVQFTKDVVDVEGAVIGIGWHLHRVSRLVKVLNQLLRHHNFSLQSLIFLFKLFLTDRFHFLRHLGASFYASSLILEFLAFSFLSLGLLFGLLATLLSLEFLSLFAQLLLVLELFSLLEQLGAHEFVLFHHELLLGLLLLASQFCLLLIHGFALEPFSLQALLQLTRLSCLTLLFFAGDLGKFCLLFGL